MEDRNKGLKLGTVALHDLVITRRGLQILALY